MAEKAAIEENIHDTAMEITNKEPDSTNNQPASDQSGESTVKWIEFDEKPINETTTGATKMEENNDGNIENDEPTSVDAESNTMEVSKDAPSVENAEEKKRNTVQETVDAEHKVTEPNSIEKTVADSVKNITDSVTSDPQENTQHGLTESTQQNMANNEKQSVTKTLGSLGLLNQYASSSDGDEDSSDDDDDNNQNADSESESDSDDSGNVEILETPAQEDKELNTLANNILNSAMSRENYRNVSSDT